VQHLPLAGLGRRDAPLPRESASGEVSVREHGVLAGRAGKGRRVPGVERDMRAIKGSAQLVLAMLCLLGAAVFCVALGVGRLFVAVWELADEFLAAAFSTEVTDFFRKPKQ
jgi:hypothetical protein